MIPNVKESLFYLRFPKNFLDEKLQKKYNDYLKHYPTAFKSITEFVNHTIQGVDIPKLTINVSDAQQTQTKFPPIFRKNQHSPNFLDRYITVTLKHVEGFVTWWLFFESIYRFYDYNTKQDYLPDLSINILNNDFLKIGTVTLSRIIYGGFDEGLSFATNSLKNTSKSFKIKLYYNELDINFLNSELVLD